jgi:hypothetical protein
MAAYPGRRWRMYELVCHVAGGKPPGRKHRDKYRAGVRLVVRALSEANVVSVEPAKRGSFAAYCWGRCDAEKC